MPGPTARPAQEGGAADARSDVYERNGRGGRRHKAAEVPVARPENVRNLARGSSRGNWTLVQCHRSGDELLAVAASSRLGLDRDDAEPAE